MIGGVNEILKMVLIMRRTNFEANSKIITTNAASRGITEFAASG